ncbi:MAG: hypothetical protein OK438_03885 [Thaumarchaeota archaeon]|nr:hypothetical protein [Nitrososphaerota archaeon]
MRAEFAGIGGFLLVFGFLWLVLAYSVAYTIYGQNVDPFQQLATQLIGLVLASVGAGLLAYSIGAKASEPRT